MDEVKTLQKLGFTEYEARAYLSLARLGPSSVKEIVSDSKLPRNKAYEALQKLEDKNKVVSLPLSPRRYKIINPDSLKEEVDNIQNSVDSLIKLSELPKVKEFKDFFWVLKGQDSIREKMASENTKAKKEILACASLSKPFYKNLRTFEEAVKRGVKVKIICSFDKKNIKVYKEYISTGMEIRVFNNKFGPLLPRVSVYDCFKARLTVGNPEIKNPEDYITLWTESKAFADMLRNHFLNMWKECIPIEKFISKI